MTEVLIRAKAYLGTDHRIHPKTIDVDQLKEGDVILKIDGAKITVERKDTLPTDPGIYYNANQEILRLGWDGEWDDGWGNAPVGFELDAGPLLWVASLPELDA